MFVDCVGPLFLFFLKHSHTLGPLPGPEHHPHSTKSPALHWADVAPQVPLLCQEGGVEVSLLTILALLTRDWRGTGCASVWLPSRLRAPRSREWDLGPVELSLALGRHVVTGAVCVGWRAFSW